MTRSTTLMRRAVFLILIIMAAALDASSAIAQDALSKADELVGLQMIPFSRTMRFDQQHSAEQIEYTSWLILRTLDPSKSWNPRHRAWTVYQSNIRHSLEQDLQQRWFRGSGTIRNLSQDPDTALARYYVQNIYAAELDNALAFFRSASGKKYMLYLRMLDTAYYRGLIELERVAVDPAFGSPEDSLAARRLAWLSKKGISLDTPPLPHEFHVAVARAIYRKAPVGDIRFALIAGTPPASGAFQRMDAFLNATDREGVRSFLASSFPEKEYQARTAWMEMLAKSQEVVPILPGELDGIADLISKWKKVHIAPNSLPRSMAQTDPSDIQITDAYETINIDDSNAAASIKACLPGAPQSVISRLAQNEAGAPRARITRAISVSSAQAIFLSRGATAACIPTTKAGFPIPAVNSFVNTIRVVGMGEAEEVRWYRAIAQEIAAGGASKSLIVLPSGLAIEVTFAVNLQQPHTFIYGTRSMPAGTYTAERYRTVEPVPNFKSIAWISPSRNNITVREKSLLTTADDIRRDQEWRANQKARPKGLPI